MDNIKEKFLRNAEGEFNDAKERREFGRIVGGVPKWIWIILALVSWNEIMWLFTSPSLMIPSLAIIAIGGAFVWTGNSYIPTFFIRKLLMLLKIY